METKRVLGHCLCGGVEFEFVGPTTAVELCHCSRCQRATGSAFASGFYVRSENFRWLRGEDLISFYDAPILSTPPAYRTSFCRVCGSPLPTVRAGSPTVEIPTGLVEGEIGVRAVDHIYVSKKASWWDGNEIAKLPAYETFSAEARKELLRPLNPK